MINALPVHEDFSLLGTKLALILVNSDIVIQVNKCTLETEDNYIYIVFNHDEVKEGLTMYTKYLNSIGYEVLFRYHV
jgi:hypothetical protein